MGKPNIQAKGDVTRDKKRRRFLAQYCSVATLLRHGFDWLQHCFNIAMLSLRRADAFPVVASLPLKNSYFPDGEKRRPEMRLLFAGYAMLCCANNRRWESSHVSLHVTSRRPCRWSRAKAFLSSGNETSFSCKFYKNMFIVLTTNMAAIKRQRNVQKSVMNMQIVLPIKRIVFSRFRCRRVVGSSSP